MRKSDSSNRTNPPWLLTVTLTLGALALLVGGGVHVQQYQYEFYSSIPTIGSLFLANFLVATALGLFLLVAISRPARRVGKFVDEAAALAGVGLAAGAFAGLAISEHTPLFGWAAEGRIADRSVGGRASRLLPRPHAR